MKHNKEIVKILRDIGGDKKNEAGDYWSPSYCIDAAEIIERQQQEVHTTVFIRRRRR